MSGCIPSNWASNLTSCQAIFGYQYYPIDKGTAFLLLFGMIFVLGMAWTILYMRKNFKDEEARK